MVSPDEARQKLHQMIDAIPDDQIAMIWMTFQTMFDVDDLLDQDDDAESPDPAAKM